MEVEVEARGAATLARQTGSSGTPMLFKLSWVVMLLKLGVVVLRRRWQAKLSQHRLVCGPEQRLVLQQWLDGHHPERGWDALSAAQPRSGSCLLSRCCSTSCNSGPQTRRCRHSAAKKGSRRHAAPHPSVPTARGWYPPGAPHNSNAPNTHLFAVRR